MRGSNAYSDDGRLEDIRELVAYAKAHGIRVIPEWDVPGHQSRNMGQGIPTLQWCDAAPPTPSDYQWQLRDDEAGVTFGVSRALCSSTAT